MKTKPYEHQQKMLDQLVKEDRSCFGLFWEMGLGKSKLVVDYAASLFKQQKITSVLIIAPKGVYRNWVDQIDIHLVDDIERELLVWQPNWTKTFIAQMISVSTPKDDDTLRIFIMNVESLSSTKGASILDKFLELNDKTFLVVDESTAVKNHKANRTKNLLKSSGKSAYKFILTGSPVTNSPLDLYSQMAVLGLDFGNFYAFKNRYAVLHRQSFGGRPFDKVVGFQRLDELSDRIQPLSSRLLKADCLDLPDKIYLTREVLLSKEQEKHYKEMKALALTMLESGELSTSASALTTLIRLQQITIGFAKPDDGETIDLPNNRLSELMQVLSEADGSKVVIYCTFRHSIKQIETEIIKQYGQDSVCTYYGDTKSEKRQEVINDFQNPDSKLRFFIGQISTAGYGITLTASSICLFFSNSFNLADRLQAEDRLHRIGQSKSVTYVDFISPKTIDVKIIKALRSKIDIASTVLGESLKDWLEI